MNDNHAPLSSDEKLMGAIPHLFGLLVALVMWMMQKDKSRFVKFQALQALVFDVVVMIVMGVLFACLFGVMFLGTFGSMVMTVEAASSPDEMAPFFMLPFMFPFTIFACVFPFSFFLLIVRIVAAVSVLGGRNFRYPILGSWVEKFLDEKP
jgi:uncharacterized Tic20 family protein